MRNLWSWWWGLIGGPALTIIGLILDAKDLPSLKPLWWQVGGVVLISVSVVALLGKAGLLPGQEQPSARADTDQKEIGPTVSGSAAAAAQPTYSRNGEKRTWCTGRFKIKVGDYFETSWRGRDIRVELKEIIKASVRLEPSGVSPYTKELDVARLRIACGAAFLSRSASVTGGATYDEFCLPRTDHTSEPYACVYSLRGLRTSFSFFSASVLHINPNASEVEVELVIAGIEDQPEKLAKAASN